VRFRYQLAGPGRRAVAWGVDLLVRLVVMIGVLVALSPFMAIDAQLAEATQGLVLVVLFVLEWLYGVLFEVLMQGRTPGKILLSLRVVRTDGSPVRVPDVVLRNLLRAVDYLPVWAPLGAGLLVVPTFGIAIGAMLVDRKFRRIGDMVGGTVVVVDVSERMHAGATIDPPVTEDERQRLPAHVSLGRDEIDVLEAFVRRRGRLPAERAEELAELFGPALSERTGIEAPTWERVLVLAYARATGKDR
jgi:uncharacterized RDD family membrane protein YckC